MKIITDINLISQISEERNEENWEFRAFLKQLDMESEEIDTIIHEINDEITKQIDCTKCANCCMTTTTELDEEDISKFSIGLKILRNQFINTYLTKEEPDKTDYVFNKLPCPLLKNNLCIHYNLRPKACISYPHLYKDEIITRLWTVVNNYSICPIVFNVYERLKEELWHNSYDNDAYEIEDY